MLYLASGSPRRRELLAQIGMPFQVLRVDVDETPAMNEAPLAYALRLAEQKAQAGLALLQEQNGAGSAVLGADTIGVLNGDILAKPRDRAEAVAMLLRMAGQTHQVITAIALATPSGVLLSHSLTSVTFRPLTEAEALAYWNTGEPADKAGAYGIQGYGAVFVSRVEGSYTGVVGLPLFETARLLQQAGLSFWQPEGVIAG